MNDVVRRLGFVSVAALLPFVATAHHSVAGTFDTSRLVEAEGVVTDLLWRNPHVRFSITAADGSDRIEQWAR